MNEQHPLFLTEPSLLIKTPSFLLRSLEEYPQWKDYFSRGPSAICFRQALLLRDRGTETTDTVSATSCIQLLKHAIPQSFSIPINMHLIPRDISCNGKQWEQDLFASSRPVSSVISWRRLPFCLIELCFQKSNASISSGLMKWKTDCFREEMKAIQCTVWGPSKNVNCQFISILDAQSRKCKWAERRTTFDLLI